MIAQLLNITWDNRGYNLSVIDLVYLQESMIFLLFNYLFAVARQPYFSKVKLIWISWPNILFYEILIIILNFYLL